ncbi:hypothetical protein [Nonomuraea gerenzanensis]|uniref:Uncharacterized protein n=1 Tax=Nonomuraea gerenzanensis TaxID=93944 RepID=A0A1M4E8C1_9ACTN|nr:hypothetical protein [Nonomuraea gerenzanensis]UBU17278.1 hypothetical protein LCN96_20315 [Nonomuraea gerenzanensis]SBO95022.1 hypothetical protein BN4615_P4538 [Nonomuraea gerenzanensis]
MSIPAPVISLNALSLSQRQRADALAQRAEDQKERAAAKAQAAYEARAANGQRVTAWASGDAFMEAGLRNANSTWVIVWVIVWVTAGDRTSVTYTVRVPPCTEMTVRPRSGEGDAC